MKNRALLIVAIVFGIVIFLGAWLFIPILKHQPQALKQPDLVLNWQYTNPISILPSIQIYGQLNLAVHQATSLTNDQILLKDWQVHQSQAGPKGCSAVQLKHPSNQHMVLLFKAPMGGTSDFQSLSLQLFAKQQIGQAIQAAQKLQYGLSISGFGIGGFLAELAAFYAHTHGHELIIPTVIFDGSGAKGYIEQHYAYSLTPDVTSKLNILHYLTHPHHINTLDSHMGTVYQLLPSHTSSREIFNVVTTLEDLVDRLTKLSVKYVTNWPIDRDYHHLFQGAVLLNSDEFMHILNSHSQFDDRLSNNSVLPLKHFPQSVQKLLKTIYLYRMEYGAPQASVLTLQLQNLGCSKKMSDALLSYTIESERSEPMVHTHMSSINALKFAQMLNEWLLQNTNRKDEFVQLFLETHKATERAGDKKQEYKAVFPF